MPFLAKSCPSPFPKFSVENYCCLTPPLTITGLFPAPGAPGTLSEPCGHPGPQSQRGSLAQRTKASENSSWQRCSPDAPWEPGPLDPQHPFSVPLSLIIRGTASSFFSRCSGSLNYSVRCGGGFPDWEVCKPPETRTTASISRKYIAEPHSPRRLVSKRVSHFHKSIKVFVNVY